MRHLKSSLVLIAAITAASAYAADTQPAGWVHATVAIKPPAPPAGTPAIAAPKPTDYYYNEKERLAAVISEIEGDRSVQFMVPNQGYMQTYSYKRNDILQSELTKSAVLPQDHSLPDTLDEALDDARHILNTDTPKDTVTTDAGKEVHTLVGATDFPKITLTLNEQKFVSRIVEDGGPTAGVTTISYDYDVKALSDIFDLGVPRTAKITNNVPAADVRAVLDQLDARAEKDPGDTVAILVTDIQAGPKGAKTHDPTAPYTAEVFIRNGGSFAYRVHTISAPPAADLDKALAELQNMPATNYIVYDGKTLFQLTYDPQTGKPLPSERAAKLDYKDFAPSNFSHRIFLGREALGCLVPISKVQLVDDPRARPGQRGLTVTRPTSLVYEEAPGKAANVPASHLTVYWSDPAKGYAPVMYHERHTPTPPTPLQEEVMETKFANYVTAPDGSVYPTTWVTGAWDVRGNSVDTNFTLNLAFNKKLDAAWFTKPALPPAPPAATNSAPAKP